MGQIKMVRIDYRMIHGQVVAKWIKFRPVQRLILGDDPLVEDPFMGDIYRMAAPGQIVDIVRLLDVKATIENTNDSIMLIFRDVESAYKAFKEGVVLPELNVGAAENKAGRKSVMQGVALSREEFEKLKEIKATGVNVYFQPIPEKDAVSLESIEKKL